MTPVERSYNQVPTNALEQALELAKLQRHQLEDQLIAAQVTVNALTNVLQQRGLL